MEISFYRVYQVEGGGEVPSAGAAGVVEAAGVGSGAGAGAGAGAGLGFTTRFLAAFLAFFFIAFLTFFFFFAKRIFTNTVLRLCKPNKTCLRRS